MKKQLTTTLFLLLSLAGFAQQKEKGVFVVVAAESTNLTRGKKLLVGTRAELGYSFGIIAVSFVGHRLLNEPTHERHASSAGIKIAGNLFHVTGIHAGIYAEGDRYIKTIDHGIRGKFEYRLGAKLSTELVKGSGVYGNIGYEKYLYEQIYQKVPTKKNKNGGSIGFTKSF